MSQPGGTNPKDDATHATHAQNAPGNGLLSEEQLVDLIDGVLPDAEAKALIERAGRSDLLVRVHAMRRHRELLSSLPDEHVPAELHDRVLAALEREALVGISTGTSDGGPPASQLRLTGEGTTPRAGPKLIHRAPGMALAAGLALLVVGGAYFGSQAWRGARPVSPIDGTAGLSRETGDGARARSTASAENTESPANDSTMAKAAPEAQGTREERGAGGTTLAQADATDTAGGMIDPPRSPYAKQTVTLERAIALAAEGRLAIRVTPATLRGLGRGLGEIERAGERRTSERQWRLSKAVPPAVLAAALPALDDRKPRAGPPRPDEGIIIAAALVRPMVGPGAAFGMTPVGLPASVPRDPSSELHASYIVDLPRTERAFDVLRMVFREKVKGEVRFVELSEPAATPPQREVSDELWWTKAPAQWTPRVAVPVLVERPRGGA
jgi:hypothetical protein